MITVIDRSVESARAGENLRLVCRVRSGWVVAGESQFLPGYCLLLPDPVVPSLNALEGEARARFLADMAAVGDAVLAETGACRINYEILGNLEPALHAHAFPRYTHEPEEWRTKPVWLYPQEHWNATPFESGQHGELLARIAARLATLGVAQP